MHFFHIVKKFIVYMKYNFIDISAWYWLSLPKNCCHLKYGTTDEDIMINILYKSFKKTTNKYTCKKNQIKTPN